MNACGFTRGPSDTPCADVYLACGGRCSAHCEYGLQSYTQRIRILQSASADFKKNEDFSKNLYSWQDHCIDVHHQPDTREKKTANGKYNGPFAFTLTMSPADNLSIDDMMLACKKIMDQQSQPVKKFAWYLEYKDPETKQHPHIHGMYETPNGRRIEKKHWVRSWKIWDENIPLGSGFRGGYHRAVRHDDAYDKYIAKQDGIGESLV